MKNHKMHRATSTATDQRHLAGLVSAKRAANGRKATVPKWRDEPRTGRRFAANRYLSLRSKWQDARRVCKIQGIAASCRARFCETSRQRKKSDRAEMARSLFFRW